MEHRLYQVLRFLQAGLYVKFYPQPRSQLPGIFDHWKFLIFLKMDSKCTFWSTNRMPSYAYTKTSMYEQYLWFLVRKKKA